MFIFSDVVHGRALMAILSDVKEILKGGEIHYYFLINECGGFIWRMNHDLADGRIDLPTDPEENKKAIASIDEDIKKMREIQTFVVSKLPEVGVEKPVKEVPLMNIGNGFVGGTITLKV
jgi:hypothetical protein